MLESARQPVGTFRARATPPGQPRRKSPGPALRSVRGSVYARPGRSCGQSSTDAEASELFAQLADLVENRPPAALLEIFRADRRRAARATTRLARGTRVVLTLREDYLSQLE